MVYRHTPTKLPLDSPRWRELRGDGARAVQLLRDLRRHLTETPEPADDALGDLIGTIHHQGDCDEVAHASVPHLVELAAELAPETATPLWILIGSIAASAHALPVPDDLRPALEDAHRHAEKGIVDLLLDERFDAPLTCLELALSAVAVTGHRIGRVLQSNLIYDDAEAECLCPRCEAAFLIALFDDGVATFTLDEPYPEHGDPAQPARGAPLTPRGPPDAMWSRVADELVTLDVPPAFRDEWRPELDAAARQAALGVAQGEDRSVLCVIGALLLLSGYQGFAARLFRLSGALRCPACKEVCELVEAVEELR